MMAHPMMAHPVMAHIWPLAVFALGVLAGSLYGRLVEGLDNTFMNMGLLMLAVPPLAWFIGRVGDPARWTRNLFFAVCSVAAADGMLQWAHFFGDTYYHGSEFVVIPMAAYCWFSRAPVLPRTAGALFFLSLAVAEHKNTGYLLALLTIGYCSFWAIRSRYKASRNQLVRERQVGMAAFTIAGLFLVALTLYALRAWLLPSGNPEYRLRTYERAFAKFLESPLAGTLFAGPATERFDLFQVTVSASNILPTHSDPLDILANGGLIYTALFLYGTWRLIRVMVKALDRAPDARMDACLPALHTCLLMFLSGVIVFSFNPVLTQPNCALMLWAAAGIGLGLALRIPADAGAQPGRAGRPARAGTAVAQPRAGVA